MSVTINPSLLNNEYLSSLSFIEETIRNVADKLQQKKMQIIKKKFTEKGFPHAFEDMEKRRFQRAMVEIDDNCEKWYADDGSYSGVLIVTFFKPDYQLTTDPNAEFKLVTEIKYA